MDAHLRTNAISFEALLITALPTAMVHHLTMAGALAAASLLTLVHVIENTLKYDSAICWATSTGAESAFCVNLLRESRW
jgi:hypothetical protein